MSASITITAPAKINLTLSIMGRREDGYHDLKSLVTFADLTDSITLAPIAGREDRLTIIGTTTKGLSALRPNDNIIIKALMLFRMATDNQQSFHVELTKSIPVAGGLGGGSADAAATLLAVNRFFDAPLGQSALEDLGVKLGADVPVCLAGHRHLFWCMEGKGEILTPVHIPKSSELGIILTNPGIAMKTSAVFDRLMETSSDALPHHQKTHHSISDKDFRNWLLDGNALTPAASGIAPVINDYLFSLSTLCVHDDFLSSGMSGSGASCFALFGNKKSATSAAKNLRRHLNWVWAGGLYSPLK
jgi:4-diphosphocytidyl-2-C-methyl-D-erythritol kinase